MNKMVYGLMLVALVVCGAESAFGQINNNDYWTGLANNGLWSDPGNWSSGVPSTNDAVFLDAANGWSTITIANGVTGYGNTIYGPEWGVTLNIHGSLDYAWMMAPVQNNPTPGMRTIINMYTNSVLYTAGAGVGIGDAWWWYQGGPYTTLNMYGNAQMDVPNVALGGHLNVYDTATVNATAAVFTGNVDAGTPGGNNNAAGETSDATASLVLGGGTLILPTGWTNEAVEPGNTVFDLAERGVLRAYGKLQDTNDLVVSDNGTNTIVTTVPLGGPLQQIYMQPLCESSMQVGDFQQIALDGNYPSVSGVLLSSAEPGVDPATLPGSPAFTSSNPNVVTVDSEGVVRAVAPGTATLSATLGTFTSTNTLSVSVVPVTATLIHRYSFNATTGTSAADSVGGATATLVGAVAFNGSGQVIFPGLTTNTAYVQLPAGILSNMSEVTIETWASIGTTTGNNYENLFAFGFSDLNTLSVTYGEGGNYITFSPHTGGGTAQLNFGQGVPGNLNGGENDAIIGSVLDGQTNIQIVGVFSPNSGNEQLYTNGVLAASALPMFNAMSDPVAFNGPYINKHSILAATMHDDPDNYLGRSLYVNDPGFKGSIDEFRIYNGPLTASQIAADYALGPNQLRGTNTNVTLTATRSGDNVVFSWPTSSALVTLQASPTLGPTTTWTTEVGKLTASNGDYQMTLPLSSSARFFRLQ